MSRPPWSVSRRAVWLTGLLAALLLAGVASFYAGAAPDGLNRVASDTGIAEAERPSPTADSPLAGYEARGVDDDRLAGGLAGVAGTLTVLLLAGGVAHAVRRSARRRPEPEPD